MWEFVVAANQVSAIGAPVGICLNGHSLQVATAIYTCVAAHATTRAVQR